mmetsp:Transcript_10205/g.62258  ORF Transcript_10205/g.62258 Transcript_10205/m.62258 type:complete len:204 (-) Transcript_10205:313-924(-)
MRCKRASIFAFNASAFAALSSIVDASATDASQRLRFLPLSDAIAAGSPSKRTRLHRTGRPATRCATSTSWTRATTTTWNECDADGRAVEGDVATRDRCADEDVPTHERARRLRRKRKETRGERRGAAEVDLELHARASCNAWEDVRPTPSGPRRRAVQFCRRASATVSCHACLGERVASCVLHRVAFDRTFQLPVRLPRFIRS